MQEDVTVYFNDGDNVYARGKITSGWWVIHIERDDGACVTVPKRLIKYIKRYPVKEVSE